MPVYFNPAARPQATKPAFPPAGRQRRKQTQVPNGPRRLGEPRRDQHRADRGGDAVSKSRGSESSRGPWLLRPTAPRGHIDMPRPTPGGCRRLRRGPRVRYEPHAPTPASHLAKSSFSETPQKGGRCDDGERPAYPGPPPIPTTAPIGRPAVPTTSPLPASGVCETPPPRGFVPSGS